MKNGKKPISQKTSFQSFQETFGNRLTIPEDVMKDIESTGKVARWVDAKQLAADQGYHKNGWVPYKRSDKIGTSVLFGNDPDGVVRRGSLILAVRGKDLDDAHKTYNTDRAARMRGKPKEAISELKKQARQIGSKVDDSFDEDDEGFKEA